MRDGERSAAELMDAVMWSRGYLGFFPPGTPPERIANAIRPLVD